MHYEGLIRPLRAYKALDGCRLDAVDFVNGVKVQGSFGFGFSELVGLGIKRRPRIGLVLESRLGGQRISRPLCWA